MAWSDKAREAALQARRMHARKQLYTPGKDSVHVYRNEMARALREARSTGLRGKGKSQGALDMATGKSFGSSYFTNVKGAHFVDQGLGGKVWRQPKGVSKSVGGKLRKAPRGGVPGWAAKSVGYYQGY